MSKVLVDREVLKKHVSEIDSWNASMEEIVGRQPDYRWASLEALRGALSQPAEAEGATDLEPILEAVAREYGMGGLSDGLYADYACDVAKRYASAALSAVTAERDRMESALVKTTARHFSQQIKGRADGKRLDECLSEGIAMLEAERDQLRAEVEASRLLLEQCNEVIAEDGGVYIELRAFLAGTMPASDVIALLRDAAMAAKEA